jgi:competence protein ComEC
MAQTEERRKAVWQTFKQWLTRGLSTKILLVALAAGTVLIWLAVAALPDGKLHVTFLDVGEGDAVWLETPSGQQVLINGGPSPVQMTAHLGRRMPFWDRTLDLVVLTDPRDEHLVGLLPILERYRVTHVVQGAQACNTPACARWRALLQERGIAVQPSAAGTRIDLGGGLILTVLHPIGEPLTGADSDVASDSLVLRVDYGQTCFLLAGGVEQGAEAAILARGEHVRCDVLQVGDHGSQQATSPIFLEAVHPALAVISCGEGNRAGHPAQETVERLTEYGATVVRTDLYGSVEVISDGVGYEVKVGR